MGKYIAHSWFVCRISSIDHKTPFFTNGLTSPVFYDIQKTTFVYSCTPDQQQQKQQHFKRLPLC